MRKGNFNTTLLFIFIKIDKMCTVNVFIPNRKFEIGTRTSA